MNKKILYSVFAITALVVVLVAYRAYADEPALSKMTCSEYWDYHKKITKSGGKEAIEKTFMPQHAELWDYHVRKFKEKHPNLNSSSMVVSESKSYDRQPFYIMTIYMACENRHEYMNQEMGDRLQSIMYKMQMANVRKERARKNGCDVEVIKKNIRDSNEEVSYLCVNEGWSKQWGKAGKTEHTHRCFVDRKTKKESCYEIKIDKENACLVEFGSCLKNSQGECGWAHTSESEKCAKK